MYNIVFVCLFTNNQSLLSVCVLSGMKKHKWSGKHNKHAKVDTHYRYIIIICYSHVAQSVTSVTSSIAYPGVVSLIGAF